MASCVPAAEAGEADNLRISVVLESRDTFAFSACCWYLHRLDPVSEALVTVLNSRDAFGRRVVLASQGRASNVWFRSALLDYDVEVSPPLPTDGKPEPFRRLRLRGPRGVLMAFVHEALDLYRRHVMSRSGHEDAGDGVACWSWDGDMWCRGRTKRVRPLDTMFLTADAERLVADFRAFCSEESLERYRRLHVAPTRVYMLHGLPGSGKTSLVQCVASDMKYGVASISGASGDGELRAALGSLPPRCILVIEDIDALFVDRQPTKQAAGITFSGLLAALDNCGCLDEGSGTGVFVTTNRLCALDPALRRRLDHVLEFGPATKEQARRMFVAFFPDSAAFEQLWQRLHGRRFAMSVLQKYLVKALQGGDPLRDFDQFDVLLECADPDNAADAAHLYS